RSWLIGTRCPDSEGWKVGVDVIAPLISGRMVSDLRVFAAFPQVQFENAPFMVAARSSHAGARLDFVADWGCSSCVALARKTHKTQKEKRRGNAHTMPTVRTLHAGIDSPFAWLRLVVVVGLATLGGRGTGGGRAGGCGRSCCRGSKSSSASPAPTLRCRSRSRWSALPWAAWSWGGSATRS